MKHDFHLDEYCQSIVDEIIQNTDTLDEALLACHEIADGSEYSTYYHKAHELCLNCKTDDGEDFLQECWSGEVMTYNQMACTIAYGEIYSRLTSLIYKYI